MQNQLPSIHINELHTAIIKVCHELELPLHYNNKGPKIFTNYQRIALIILFLRSKKNLRDFIKELPELRWVQWLNLREIPGKSTLNDWMNFFNLSFIRDIHKKIIKKLNPKIAAIDGTGIDSWQRSRHYEKRINDSNMPFAKLDILIDIDTHAILDFILKIKPRHDVIGAKSIFQRLKYSSLLILGDKGYDSEELHQLVIKNNCQFYAPVRDFHVNKPKGKNRKRCLTRHPEYSRRNSVESVFHAIKSKWNSLKSRKDYMKKREMGWKVIIYNLDRLNNKITKLIKLLINCLFRTRPYFPKIKIFFPSDFR